MKGFIAGIVVALLVTSTAVFFFVQSNWMPVAANDAPLPFEKWLAKMGLHARLKAQAPQRDAASFTAQDLLAGAQVYRRQCAFCHGLPQGPSSVAGKGMFPDAPQLLHSDEMVTDDPVGETYWRVRNGIRLTGMPSFTGGLSDEQIWQVSALLARADKLPPEVQSALETELDAGTATAAPPSTGSPSGQTLAHQSKTKAAAKMGNEPQP
jgi:mono/diheme cytochrome c family protein